MSNNPGKKGKPAPWIKRAEAEKRRAFDEYRRAHHTAYDAWCIRRGEAAAGFMKQEEAKNPGWSGFYDAMKASDKRLRKWDKENPSPLSWEDYTRLEAEFDAQYIARDYS